MNKLIMNNDNWLKGYLEDIFAEDKIDEFKIGTYFAHLFTYNFEDSLADLPDYICEPMRKVEKLLRRQFSKDSFWIIDEDFLYEVGEIVLEIKTNDIIEYMKVAEALGGDDEDDDEDCDADEDYDYDGEDSDGDDEYIENFAAQPAPDKKKKKAKRKAQKQARKNNRRKK